MLDGMTTVRASLTTDLHPSPGTHGLAAAGSLTEADQLPVVEQIGELLPDGLRRGIVVSVRSTSLLLTLLAAPTQSGSWAAIVGLPSLGLIAATEIGVCLERCVLIPIIDRKWPVAIASLLDAVDVVVVRSATQIGHGDARRLTARARERRSVLMLFDTRWPERTALELDVERRHWSGVAEGKGRFVRCEMHATASGRGNLARRKQACICLYEQLRVS